MRAVLKHNRQSPRKVRLIADMIRGKQVTDALTLLKHTPKKASASLLKLLEGAVANAKRVGGKNENDLYIDKITVDKGFTMKRHIPKWRGTADPIRKHTSNIIVELGEKTNKKGKVKSEKVVTDTGVNKESVKK